jgi:rRNA maturation endonuclease Nob1
MGYEVKCTVCGKVSTSLLECKCADCGSPLDIKVEKAFGEKDIIARIF